ncbi:hypothetical protein CC86DRAFT_196317 [Ophiobolus disseminans]|uniref:Uncharacterized protein n=1 Tax=Ophiobolus disseminans TaxID=1469910 RepID=A0A6A7A671_9PLEO|nr:hypothetical protein CC86DRAFT_196317 [Ophiobolus disseminans]
MTQSGELKVRGTAPGPYGPGNPPPPPPGPPPRNTDRKRSRDSAVDLPAPPPQSPSSAKKYEKSFRKLNSRQKKFRKQAMDNARFNESRDRGRSRSPVRGEGRGSQVRNREEPFLNGNGTGGYQGRTSLSGSQDRRQPLKQARQFTPDQILDETYGRLSPGMDGRDSYRQTSVDTHRRPVARNEWPEDQSWSPRQTVDAPGYASQEHTGWQAQVTPSPNQPTLGHGEGTGGHMQKHGIASLPPRPPSQAFNIEDEVDWGDDDPAGMPEPIRSSTLPTYSDAYAAYSDRIPQHKGQTQEQAFSPVHDEQPRQQQSWRGSDHQPIWKEETHQDTWNGGDHKKPWKGQNQQPQHQNGPPLWGPDPNQRPPKTRSGKPRQRDFNGPDYVDMTPFKKPVDRAQSFESLLQPDPALVQGPQVPETVYDLRKYDGHITALHKGLPPKQRFINGNGKVAPYVYGTVQGLDLGLCFSTFCTGFKCEMGVKCAWRHHPLTKSEREWILAKGGSRGKRFLENLVHYWAVPEVPVPGASMHDR